MMITPKAKENLLRLWKSTDVKNHELAFTILDGLDLQKEDVQWLWEAYLNVFPPSSRRTTLTNFPNISTTDIIKGNILDSIFCSPHCTEDVLDAFQYRQGYRIPYCTSKMIPGNLFSMGKQMETLTWQDGELESIDSRIIQLQQLRRLDLRRQPITYIDAVIAELPKLEEIHLVSTSFIPPELSERHDVEIYTDAPY